MNLKHIRFLLFIMLYLPILAVSENPKLPLIPMPKNVKVNAGNFIISKATNLSASAELTNEVKYLNTYFKNNHQIVFNLDKKAGNKIVLKINSSLPNLLGTYSISSNSNELILEAFDASGIFYGIQSIIQLLPINQVNEVSIPLIQVSDQPKYQWRGMHLDCSRHFFNTTFIKKYIDMLAYYKMNKFHWHLTDDQGWRIEIKKYPKLTEVGAWRNGTMIGHYRDQKIDSIKYGGFYTQSDIKEIITYAQERHIEVIPEIEMPGHALAALAAYPEFSCSKLPTQVGTRWGVETNVFCPSEETFHFLEDILNEVMEIFPSKYIHIGGDEVPKDEWNKSDLCQQLMKDQNLADANELQSYFIRRIEKLVNKKGKTIIGWDEILEGGLAPNAVVMSWRGESGGITAAKMKHPVIMSPGSHCYFDHYQASPEKEPLAIGGFTSLEKVYSYNPTPIALDSTEATFILGAQGNVWTEYIKTPSQVEYMMMPRMAALAEVVWLSKDKQNYSDFLGRLTLQIPYLNYKKINFCQTEFSK